MTEQMRIIFFFDFTFLSKIILDVSVITFKKSIVTHEKKIDIYRF